MTSYTPLGIPTPDPSAPAAVPADLLAMAAVIDSLISTNTAAGSGVFSVISYGADKTGVANADSAFQSCYNAAAAYSAAYGQATIVMPAGEYKMSATVRPHLPGSGLIVWAYGARIFNAAGATTGLLSNFASTDSFSGFAGNSYITIYGGVWDAVGQSAPTDAAFDTMDFNHCRGIKVRDAIFRNGCSDHALEFNSTDGGQALNCRFEGFRDATSGSTRQFSEAVQIDCAVAGSASIPVYDNTHSTNVLVDGCYMGPSTDGSGLGSYGKLVGSHTTTAGQTYDNIKIVNNTCDGAKNVGVGAYNWSNFIIANNKINNTVSHGIEVTVPDPVAAGFSVLSAHGIVANNDVNTTSGTAVGIRVVGFTASAGVTDINVSTNTVSNTGGNGIFCQLTQNQLISGNIVDTTGSNCINVTACQYALVIGNTARNPATNYCIFFGQVTSPSTVSTTDSRIEGNMCQLGSGAAGGIRLSTGTSLCVVTNCTIRKAGSAGTIAVSCASGAGLTNWVVSNDLSGYGDNAATITIVSGTITKTIAVGTNVGTNIF